MILNMLYAIYKNAHCTHTGIDINTRISAIYDFLFPIMIVYTYRRDLLLADIKKEMTRDSICRLEIRNQR